MALKVIGAGYGRTGTASLKLALDRLGFGPTHHMSEVLPNPERVERWTRIGRGEAQQNPSLWDDAFEGFGSTVDWPACTHWRALMSHYPDAKVILTRRDPGKWFESVNATILKPEVNAALAKTPMGTMLEANIWRLFGDKIDDRDHMMASFERHCDEVMQGVPAERLLVFEVKDGWGPLCEFLGVEVPGEAFPHVNSKAETAKVMGELAAQIELGATSAAKEFADEIYQKGQKPGV